MALAVLLNEAEIAGASVLMATITTMAMSASKPPQNTMRCLEESSFNCAYQPGSATSVANGAAVLLN